MDGSTNSESTASDPSLAEEAGWTDAKREQRRQNALDEISPHYNPWVHLAIPSLGAIGIIATSLWLMRGFRWLDLIVVPLTYVLLNAGEWAVHKGLLHKRRPHFELLYDRHTPLHHMVFVTEDMSLRSWREFRLVLMPAPAILAAFLLALPLPALLLLVGQWNMAMLCAATLMFYMVSYEWLHLAYHLPPTTFIGRSRLIGVLRRHHATHHDPKLMRKWNFNVTVPIWDFVSGSIYKPVSSAAPEPEPDAQHARSRS